LYLVSAAPVLDRISFDALRSSCTRPIFLALVESFAEHIFVLQHELATCVSRSDASNLRRIIQEYHDFATSFGAVRLAAFAACLEADDLDPPDEAVRKIGALAEETWVEIEGALRGSNGVKSFRELDV
jgi:hypothetical protein